MNLEVLLEQFLYRTPLLIVSVSALVAGLLLMKRSLRAGTILLLGGLLSLLSMVMSVVWFTYAISQANSGNPTLITSLMYRVSSMAFMTLYSVGFGLFVVAALVGRRPQHHDTHTS